MNDRMFDVSALGEILIDFTPSGYSPQGNPLFERNPGGAPANVLASLAKLGRSTAFIGKVGNDIFGCYLVDIISKTGIETRGMRFSDTARTTLAFVQLDEHGDRSFSFYRNPGADTTLSTDDLDYTIINNSHIFHFGSLSLTDEPSRQATLTALKHAKNTGKTISYDPNLRPLLWNSLNEARDQILSVIHYSDILKISDDELIFLTDNSDLDTGTMHIYEKYNIPLIFVTRGAHGAYYRFGDITGIQKAFSSLKSVDTTGAGDSFLGSVLYGLLSRNIYNPADLDPKHLPEITRFACAAAGLCTTGKGAIPSMPSLDEVLKLLKTNN
jgi:fructokinase